MMALSASNPPTTPRRVKVYELRNNDWFDRGTGYCTGQLVDVRLSRVYLCRRDAHGAVLIFYPSIAGGGEGGVFFYSTIDGCFQFPGCRWLILVAMCCRMNHIFK